METDRASERAAEEGRAAPAGRAFAQMSGGEKLCHVLKVLACVFTFGIAFPNVMRD
jgi:hypothetical protein